jgi:hypothetical protein
MPQAKVEVVFVLVVARLGHDPEGCSEWAFYLLAEQFLFVSPITLISGEEVIRIKAGNPFRIKDFSR